ncbi:hypothetical protein [Pseudoalteromonas luteoviolacea]|uniref:Uncharacterized protein n=1 Tax=Pseudoalteromonas luteoviolacea (strain 2ta16) TaxID=1353533 RepID=V4HSB3_PSEL2|nr:hypothetical protein [Pseudoalteromonas luteoviolacea]ESP90794.1 hypothetical protein PL2TA16_01898 [Pseudoalteromonas luteoviolacea 2ta16]KZN41631.1 hypothetical protein N483_13255 [Pseudoalteromonas luteoviolacea NCIMB 1944]
MKVLDKEILSLIFGGGPANGVGEIPPQAQAIEPKNFENGN